MEKTSQDKYSVLVKKVLGELARLNQLHTLHLTSIAKGIESATNDKRKIIFCSRPKSDFNHEKPIGVMLTQEYKATFVGAQGEKTIYEHFLYYPEPDGDPNDRLRARFLVAHELGHILMHVPESADEDKRIFRPIPDAPSLYAVNHTDEEECSADLFAAILCEQREQPVRPNSFREPCLRRLLDFYDLEVFNSDAKEIIQVLSSCII